MATHEQARAAVTELALRLSQVDEDTRTRIPSRSVSVLLHDLGTAFHGRLDSGELVDITSADAAAAPKTEVRLVMSSDQLIGLVDGDVNFAKSWATGKIRVNASLRDILELRHFL